MANLVPMQSRLGELSALETNLWRAFNGAEAKYIPPSLNPWSVTANFLRLRRQGYLRLYEFYLGRLNERFMRIEDAFGKMKRRV